MQVIHTALSSSNLLSYLKIGTEFLEMYNVLNHAYQISSNRIFLGTCLYIVDWFVVFAGNSQKQVTNI